MKWIMALMALVVLDAAANAQEAPTLDSLRSKYEAADQAAKKVAAQLRASTKPAKVESLSAELREQVSKAFRLRDEMQTMELDQAATKLDAAREQLVRRRKLADSIIQTRVAELTQSEDLEWAPKQNDGEAGVELVAPESIGVLQATESEGGTLGSSIDFYPVLGFHINDGARIVERYNFKAGTKFRGGLQISQLEPFGIASSQSLVFGDILLGIDSYQTTKIDELNRALLRVEDMNEKDVKFFVLRNYEILYGTFDVKSIAAAIKSRRKDMKQHLLDQLNSVKERRDKYMSQLESYHASKNTKLEDYRPNFKLESDAIKRLEEQRAERQAMVDEVESIISEYKDSGQTKQMMIRMNTLLEHDGSWTDKETMIESARTSTKQQVDTVDAKIAALRELTRKRAYQEMQESRDSKIRTAESSLQKTQASIKELETALADLSGKDD